MHAANHPQTTHLQCDVFEVDPLEATGGRPVGLLWASPDCWHFQQGQGGKPRSKKIARSPGVVVKWATVVRPRVIMLENVEEFVTWGRSARTTSPARSARGRPSVAGSARAAAPRLCGRVEGIARVRLRRAHDPEAVLPRRAVRWAGHHRRSRRTRSRLAARFCKGKLLPWRTAADCLDFSLPCPSIFLTKEEGRAIGVKRPLAEATMRRIARGRVPIRAERAEALHREHPKRRTRWPAAARAASTKPAWTVTGEGSQGAVAVPVLTEHANASRAASWTPGEPLRTQCRRGQGGHFALATAFLTKYRADNAGSAADAPFPTITANGDSDEPGGNPPLALVAATWSRRTAGTMTGTGARWMPVSTVLGTGSQQRLVTTHLEAFGQNAKGFGPEVPFQTVLAGATRYAEVRAFLIAYYGNRRTDAAFPTDGDGGQPRALRLGHRRRRGLRNCGHRPTHAPPRASSTARRASRELHHRPWRRRPEAAEGRAGARMQEQRLPADGARAGQANVGAFRDVGLGRQRHDGAPLHRRRPRGHMGFSWGRFPRARRRARQYRLFRRDHRGRTCAEIRRFFPESRLVRGNRRQLVARAGCAARAASTACSSRWRTPPREPATELIPREPRRMKQPRKDIAARAVCLAAAGLNACARHGGGAFQEAHMTIPACPLQWPPGWKRTERAWRTTARFVKKQHAGYYPSGRPTPGTPSLSIADGVSRVRAELRRMGVLDDDLVISSDLQLRPGRVPEVLAARTGRSRRRGLLDRRRRIAVHGHRPVRPNRRTTSPPSRRRSTRCAPSNGNGGAEILNRVHRVHRAAVLGRVVVGHTRRRANAPHRDRFGVPAPAQRTRGQGWRRRAVRPGPACLRAGDPRETGP